MRKQKIKIVCLIKDLNLGGAEKDIVNICKELDRSKFDIRFLVVRKSKNIEKFPFPYHVLSLPSPKFSFFAILKYFQKEKPDIFITLIYSTVPLLVLAKLFSRVKTKICAFVLTDLPVYLKYTRGVFYRIFFTPILKFSFSFLDCLFTNSLAAKISFHQKFGILENKIKIVYSAIIDENFWEATNEEVKEDIFQKSIPKILYLGRLAKEKGVPLLLKAFKILLSSQGQGYQLIIIGEGKERKHLERLTKNLRITKNVHFLGFRSNPYKYLKRVDLLILPSYTESLPRVIAEALACGVPPIVTVSSPDIKELIIDQKTGFVVDKRDPALLASKIRSAFKNIDFLKRNILQSSERLDKFKTKNTANQFKNIIFQLINS